MKKKYNAAETTTPSKRFSWTRFIVKSLAALIILTISAYLCLAWYINTHKKEVLALVTTELNSGLNGTLVIGGMEATLLGGFPGISMRLENVVLRDSLYTTHKRTLLDAKEVDIAVNTLALLRGAIEIKKVTVINAQANIFTDAEGYTNTSVFKKKEQDNGGSSEEGSFPELRRLTLEDVTFTAENLKMGKLFTFKAHELDTRLTYLADGWQADITLETFAQSMAFSTRKGSFIKDKEIKGSLDITYSEKENTIQFAENELNIGGEVFDIAAKFETGDKSGFEVNIKNKSILWLNAANLLSPNITEKLMMFDIKKPFNVTCDISGDLNEKGDPLIEVKATIENNKLDTPGGIVDNCSFIGRFTNRNEQSKGINDANSIITLTDFKGSYAEMPFAMKKASILNLEKPMMFGDFTSEFNVAKLGNIINDDLLKFTKGTASVKLDYKADIENFELAKPLVNGIIAIKGANVSYVPRNLNFSDVSVNLNFTKDNLHISSIKLKSGKSVVNMEGSIKNFLNLYYTAPEKIVLTWQMDSTELHLGEFMGFMGSRKGSQAVKTTEAKGNFTEELNTLFEKSNVDMKLRVSKVYYKNFYATNAKADILLTGKGINVNNAQLWHAGGLITLNGSLSQNGAVNKYAVNAAVGNVDVSKLFYAFDNFGMETLNNTNLKGMVTSKANINGSITDEGTLVPKSMSGNIAFGLKNGALLNFDPVKSVGKFAFPFRNMDTITFTNLNGKFDVKGEKVTIYPMQVNSSILNMDVEGIYSFGKGTAIYVDVPLRNPKRDKGITDEDELAKRRNRGIVIHLIAADDENGAVKVKLGKKKD